MNILKQRDLAQKVLNDFTVKRLIDFNGLVAGGAPRNWDFGMLANDIDIFGTLSQEVLSLATSKKAHFANIESKIKEIFPAAADIKLLGKDDSSYHRLSVEFILEDMKFQLITEELVMKAILGFDFGLNKIWMNHEGEIVKHYQYEIDKEEQKLTFYPDITWKSNTYKKLAMRKKRMLSMFPNFQIDIGEMTEEQVRECEEFCMKHQTESHARMTEFLKETGTINDDDEDDSLEDSIEAEIQAYGIGSLSTKKLASIVNAPVYYTTYKLSP
jgi:hypothetical protein